VDGSSSKELEGRAPSWHNKSICGASIPPGGPTITLPVEGAAPGGRDLGLDGRSDVTTSREGWGSNTWLEVDGVKHRSWSAIDLVNIINVCGYPVFYLNVLTLNLA